MKCPNCGLENIDADQCGKCGASLARPQVTISTQRSHIRKRNSWVLITTAVIVIVVFFALVYVIFMPSQIITPTTPTASLLADTNSSRYWSFSIIAISQTNVQYTDCTVLLTVGDHHSAAITPTPSVETLIPISSGNATSYTMNISSAGVQGYMAAGDDFLIGPVENATGNNAYQPTGTKVTLTKYYTLTGGAIASSSLVL